MSQFLGDFIAESEQTVPTRSRFSEDGLNVTTGATTGALAGAVLGASGGPLGFMAGALIGGVVGGYAASGPENPGYPEPWHERQEALPAHEEEDREGA